MLIIIKNIPKELNRVLLEDLLKRTLDDAFWLSKGEVKGVKVVQAENRSGEVIEYHCIALIEPDVAAKRVIRILTGHLFFGVKLKVSEYTVRNWHNDRRQAGKYKHAPREKRGSERRRYLRIDTRNG